LHTSGEDDLKPKLLAVLIALVLVLGGVGYVLRPSSGSKTVAASIVTEISQRNPLPGEKVTITGSVLPQGRPVTLQVQSDGKWAEKASAGTGEDGAFSFSVEATETPAVYRVFAPEAEVDGDEHSAVRSKRITVAAVASRGSLALLAPVGQSQEGDGKDEDERLTPGTASFTPPREGAEVEVQRERAGSWSTVATGEQDADGRFSFLVDAGGDRLRAVTEVDKGKTVTTNAVKTSDWKLAWSDDFTGTRLGPDW
jgi:hypothetical protein